MTTYIPLARGAGNRPSVASLLDLSDSTIRSIRTKYPDFPKSHPCDIGAGKHPVRLVAVDEVLRWAATHKWLRDRVVVYSMKPAKRGKR